MENVNSKEPKGEKQSLRDLFPNFSEERLQAVEDTFYGYLEIAWRIYDRLQREHPEFFDSLKSTH